MKDVSQIHSSPPWPRGPCWEGGAAQRRTLVHTAPIKQALMLCLEGEDLGGNSVREAKGLRSMGLR